MDYEQMLNKALEKIQKKTSSARFKMPALVLETSGNRTIIRNFSEILSAIRRKGEHLAKFLFKELATPGTIQGGMLVLQTKIPNDTLQKKINDYLREYVYCKMCGEPDTRVEKDGRITFVICEACGAKRPSR